MLSVHELFYGGTEPVWAVDTAAAQVIRPNLQHKPSRQPNAPSRDSPHSSQLAYFQDPPNVYRDSTYPHRDSQPHTRPRQHSPRHDDRSSSQYQNHRHNDTNSPHSDHHDAQYSGHPQKRLPQSSHYDVNDGYQHNSQVKNFNDYKRPEMSVVRMKVPICCEACEERVVGCLTSMRGVYSVQCDLCMEKVTVYGNEPPADILKACKKLFKKSEMWDSYDH